MCKLSALIPSHVFSNTDPKHLMTVLENSMVTCFVHTTVTLGQPAGLSKEVCLYAGADWLKLICQSEGGQPPRSTGPTWGGLTTEDTKCTAPSPQ